MPLLLGKKATRLDPRTLKLGDYLLGTPSLTVPRSRDWGKTVKEWPQLGNNSYGDCVEAAAYHQIQAWLWLADKAPTPPTEGDTLEAYSEITGFNRNDPATDQGTDMLTALNFWRKTGLPYGTQRHSATGYAKVNHSDHAEVKLTIAEFGGAFLGADMPLSARDQFALGQPWSVVRGPQGVPGSWGGHAVYACAYNTHGLTVITWGKRQTMSWNFFETYVSEAYAVLAGDWISPSGLAPSGVNLDQLTAAIAEIT